MAKTGQTRFPVILYMPKGRAIINKKNTVVDNSCATIMLLNTYHTKSKCVILKNAVADSKMFG